MRRARTHAAAADDTLSNRYVSRYTTVFGSLTSPMHLGLSQRIIGWACCVAETGEQMRELELSYAMPW